MAFSTTVVATVAATIAPCIHRLSNARALSAGHFFRFKAGTPNTVKAFRVCIIFAMLSVCLIDKSLRR